MYMFKNAYFGKAYKTRDGREALYLNFCHSTGHHELITSDLQDIECNGSGLYIDDDIDLDIISEWHEELDDKELRELAKRECPFDQYEDTESCIDFEKGFKAGYRKAIE